MMLTAPLVLMAAVAIAAIIIPAWRASRVEPLAALKRKS
jgi:ABC-type lipoprotein release transport system permease subunit